MSEFCFRLPVQWKLSSHHVTSIFVVGLDGIPLPCKVMIDRESAAAAHGPIVHVARNRDESGRVYFVYPLVARGEMLLCTGTLPVRELAFDLLKELARGTINRLRNQQSIWEEGGLIVSDKVRQTVAQATGLLARAIMSDNPVEQDQMAAAAIELGVDAIFELSTVFGQQISQYRLAQPGLSRFWMANTAGHGDQRLPSLADGDFNLVRLNDCWETSDTPVTNPSGSRKKIVGPWLDASAGGISDLFQDTIGHLERRNVLLKACRAGLEGLTEDVALIQLVGGLNGIGHRHLSYPQQLQLTIDLLQLADESLVELPVMVSFDFPWGERLAGAVGGIHPLQIADTLLRQGIRISYFGLEINLDYWPGGSVIRDPLQWIDLIDTWAQLELPLVLCLRVPSGGHPVPADQPVDRRVNQQRSNVTEQQRLDFLQVVLPMMVARPIVHGIIWSQWQDSDDDRFPHGGLVDANGNPKPVAAVITQLRQLIQD